MKREPLIPLTDRQKEVAECVADGLTNREIAAHLKVSVPYVKDLNTAIFKAYAVKNRSEFIVAYHGVQRIWICPACFGANSLDHSECQFCKANRKGIKSR